MQVFQNFAKNVLTDDGYDNVMKWGGKGAGLAKMARAGYPVPPGFTISTDMCHMFQEQPEAVMDAIMADIDEHLEFVKSWFGYMPLLSVRSGAPISMPGMMDTILNVGLTLDNVEEWAGRIGKRTMADSHRRLLQMMGSTALGIEHAKFEHEMTLARLNAKVATDAELSFDDLAAIVERFTEIYVEHQIVPPATLKEQLRFCIKAVFDSWMSPNAIEYRKIENIDAALGTAVTVQAMVFGNMNDNSGSGVLFTRNPATGEKKIFAEYLTNAQGEDVVAGIRTPEVLDLEATKMKDWQTQLRELCFKLEDDYSDMVDAEFTVQDGELFMLQSRVGKRSAQAAFKIAVDLRNEGEITEQDMLSRIRRKHLLAIRRPGIDPKFTGKPAWTGIAGSIGIATGVVAKSSEQAVQMACNGSNVILVTEETTPDDIAGMHASVGILTRTGGATSHAAVVARGMDKPCVVGCTDLDLGLLSEGETISIDGETGRVWKEAVPVIGGKYSPEAQEFLDRLLESAGVIPQSVAPTPGAAIPLASWMEADDLQIEAMIKSAIKLLDAGHEVMFDITPPSEFGDASDAEIWDIAGSVPESEYFTVRILHPVLHGGLSKAKVIGGTADQRELFEMKGFKVMGAAKTLTELVSATGIIQISPEMMKFVGDDGLKLLKDQGMFKGKVFAGSLPPAYAALQLLGE